MHVVDQRGRVHSAGDGVVRLMAVWPRTRPLSWAARLLPPVRRRIAERYERLAGRRGELSDRVPDAEATVVRPGWVRAPE